MQVLDHFESNSYHIHQETCSEKGKPGLLQRGFVHVWKVVSYRQLTFSHYKEQTIMHGFIDFYL